MSRSRVPAFLLGLVLCSLTAFAQEGASGPEIRKQLEALEAARAAGILTPEEYEAKKAALLERRAALAASAEEKLAALEEARAAGLLSEEQYEQKKAELLGGARPSPLPEGRKGKTYRHVIGFTFWYPERWRVQATADYLQLVPPEAATGGDGPEELYLITGESVAGEGIRSAADPRVTAYMDQQVTGLSPILRRIGGPREVATARGGGIVLDWRGKNPDGETVLARAFVNILGDSGVSLLALGLAPHIERRDAELRAIFASFGFEEGRRDPALAGGWQLVSTVSISNNSPFETSWSNAQAVSETKTTLTLRPDGTFERIEDYHAILLGGGVSLEDKRRTVTRGRWNAGEGILCLMGEEDTWEEYRYRLADGRLRLAAGDTGTIWQR